jgi:hypothetical protein
VLLLWCCCSGAAALVLLLWCCCSGAAALVLLLWCWRSCAGGACAGAQVLVRLCWCRLCWCRAGAAGAAGACAGAPVLWCAGGISARRRGRWQLVAGRRVLAAAAARRRGLAPHTAAGGLAGRRQEAGGGRREVGRAAGAEGQEAGPALGRGAHPRCPDARARVAQAAESCPPCATSSPPSCWRLAPLDHTPPETHNTQPGASRTPLYHSHRQQPARFSDSQRRCSARPRAASSRGHTGQQQGRRSPAALC